MMRRAGGNYLRGLIFFLSISCIIALSKESLAKEEEKNMEFVSVLGVSRVMANAFPSNAMLEGMSELKIAGGVYTYTNGDNGRCGNYNTCNETIQSEDGQGVSLSLVHAYNQHFGIGVIGGYVKNDGTIGAQSHSRIAYTDSRKYSGSIEGQGEVAAVSIIFDPFSDPDGFRLSFMIGLSYQNISEEWDVPFAFTASTGSTLTGHRGQDKGEYSMSSFGYLAGISIQFNTGPFRWSPFGFVSDSFSNGKFSWTVKNLNTGNSITVNEEEGADNPVGIGRPITYIPLGLSFTYILDIGGHTEGGSINTYILSWSKKW